MEISYCHTWLNGQRDYKSGLEFYLKFGNNDALKRLLSIGATKFNVAKLTTEIESIARLNPELILPGLSKKKINREILPDNLKIEFDKLKGLIQTISHHHSRLDLIQNDADRYNCAGTILNAVEERRMIFKRIDNFLEHGTDLIKKEVIKVPVVKILSDDPEIKKLQLKNNLILLRSQRSKLKNKPHRVSDYNKVLSDIKEIEKQLKE